MRNDARDALDRSRPLLAGARWRLAAGPRLRAALGRPLPGPAAGAALWISDAERLTPADARLLRGRPVVLQVEAAALGRLALDRLAEASGAAAVLVVADVASAAPAARSMAARLQGWRGWPDAAGLALRVGPGDAAALVDARDAMPAAAGPGHVELQPAAAATMGGPGPTTAHSRLDALLEALRECPSVWRFGDAWPRAALPETAQEVPGLGQARPTWLDELDAMGRARPRPSTGPLLPRWSEASEWLALELGLRRVWRADLDPALAADLERAAAERGFASLRGAAVEIDVAGLWHDRGGHRALLYVGPSLDDLREADRLERATLALTAERRAARVSHAGGVDPNADNDRGMAALLGYPTCCTEAFVAGHQAWIAADADRLAEVAAFALWAARAGGGADRRLDITSPLAGATPLRHYPCRLDCPASIALAAAIDAEAWRRDPARRARDAEVRADATLLFASGAALPLRGRRDGAGLRAPSPITAGPIAWAPHWSALQATVAPLLADAAMLLPTHALDGQGGVTVVGHDGQHRALGLPGGFPQPHDHPEFPRLLVFADA